MVPAIVAAVAGRSAGSRRVVDRDAKNRVCRSHESEAPSGPRYVGTNVMSFSAAQVFSGSDVVRCPPPRAGAGRHTFTRYRLFGWRSL